MCKMIAGLSHVQGPIGSTKTNLQNKELDKSDEINRQESIKRYLSVRSTNITTNQSTKETSYCFFFSSFARNRRLLKYKGFCELSVHNL